MRNYTENIMTDAMIYTIIVIVCGVLPMMNTIWLHGRDNETFRIVFPLVMVWSVVCGIIGHII